MQLSERKKMILRAIVNEYVETAEPVGSAVVVEKYHAGCSSATVRNEMAELEELGYLDKPHTSAGRIPSGRGYRFYVNSLLPRKMQGNVMAQLQRAFSERMAEEEDMLANALDLISRFTNYTVIASECFDNSSRRHVYTGGVVNIFNHPEYNRNLEKARRLIHFIDSRDSIYKVISECADSGRLQISIGDENTFEDLKDCSVVISRYHDRSGRYGGVGIIGPTRMQYSRVFDSLAAVTEIIQRRMNEEEG